MLISRSLISLTSRSSNVRCACSTRPLAELVLAQMPVMCSSFIARVDAEHAGLVAVKHQRLAVLLQISARGFIIVERGLGADEMKLHQAVGCIIHTNQQRAGRAAFLEPAVIAAVDLYQLTNACAPVTRLLNFRGAMPARDPEA